MRVLSVAGDRTVEDYEESQGGFHSRVLLSGAPVESILMSVIFSR